MIGSFRTHFSLSWRTQCDPINIQSNEAKSFKYKLLFTLMRLCSKALLTWDSKWYHKRNKYQTLGRPCSKIALHQPSSIVCWIYYFCERKRQVLKLTQFVRHSSVTDSRCWLWDVLRNYNWNHSCMRCGVDNSMTSSIQNESTGLVPLVSSYTQQIVIV